MHATGRRRVPLRTPPPRADHAVRLVQQHAASFIAHTEANTGAELSPFIKDEFDAFLECGIQAHGFLRLRCGECGHDKLLASSCERRGFCPSCAPGGCRRPPSTWWATYPPCLEARGRRGEDAGDRSRSAQATQSREEWQLNRCRSREHPGRPRHVVVRPGALPSLSSRLNP